MKGVFLAMLMFVAPGVWSTTLGEQLKTWRTTQSLTQCQAAARVSVSCSTWGRWERDESAPSAYNLETLTNLGILSPVVDGLTDVTMRFDGSPAPNALRELEVELPDGSRVIEYVEP